MKIVTFLMAVAILTALFLLFGVVQNGWLQLGIGLVVADLLLTVFGKKPLFKPGRMALEGHPELSPSDGYI